MKIRNKDIFCSFIFFFYARIENSGGYEEVLEEAASSIEAEPYFKAVDRPMAEAILQNRVDGSCLVRPFQYNVYVKIVFDLFEKKKKIYIVFFCRMI